MEVICCAITVSTWRPAQIEREVNTPRSHIAQKKDGSMLCRNRIYIRADNSPSRTPQRAQKDQSQTAADGVKCTRCGRAIKKGQNNALEGNILSVDIIVNLCLVYLFNSHICS